MMKRTVFVALMSFAFASGCASVGEKWKALIRGSSADRQATNQQVKSSTPRFSENESVRAPAERQYRRMSRQRFEEEAEVSANAGSLWVMEGQGSYLFAQNTTRLVGDPLNVRIEGNPRSQLQTKTRVIAKLLDRLEKPETPPSVRSPAAAQPAVAQPNQQGAPQGATANNNNVPNDQNQAAAGANEAAPAGAEAAAKPAAPAKPDPFNVQAVPTRIVEVLRDGSYRIRGSQELMIGKREYRVIVTGIVRPEDFNEEGIAADKLLDSQFDIVSAKKGSAL